MRTRARRLGSGLVQPPRVGSGLVALAWVLGPSLALADEPVVQRQTWSGHVGFFATGAPMAVDGPDGDTTNADTLAQPAHVDVGPPDVPAVGQVRAAFLYWGGSIAESACLNPAAVDSTVDFTAPGGVPTAVVADACFCSTAGALSYDVQACRADVTPLVGGLTGTYTVDGFAALIGNQSTHNASFSIVLIYEDAMLPPRRVALYDGLLTMSSAIDPEEIITLDGLDIDDPPSGDLTWYVLEGDVGGGAGESVQVTGIPGGATLVLSDAWNPPDNPMNHTITTTTPVQTNLIGVDVDRFAIDGALGATDTAVQVRYTAGMDKWWLVYNVVGVNVFEPVLHADSDKSWVLHEDADADGLPSPGDVVRYTLHLENSGNAAGTVALSDPIPPQAASWMLVSSGGGTDVSVGNTAAVVGIPLAVGGTAEVVIDIVIDDVPDGTVVSNVAEYAAQPGTAQGYLVAPLLVVSNRGGNGSGTSGSSSGGETTDADPSTSTGEGVDESGTPGSTSAATSGGGSGIGTTETPELPADTGTGAQGSTSGSAPGSSAGAEGCGCRGTAPSGRAAWLGLGLGLLGLRRRRA